jgi:uncharacterized protein (TIGR02646 family)
MKNVLKSAEPQVLTDYQKRFIKQALPRTWDQFRSNRKSDSVCEQLAVDQKGVCAYCEIDITERDRSVEHVIPKHTSTKGNNYHLSWPNLLIVCKGGLEATATGAGEVPSYRQSLPPNVQPSCGAAKREKVPDGRLLNPLDLPSFPRLFRVNTLHGDIAPDPDECANANINVADADFTIGLLGLNCERLKANRLAVILQLEEDLQNLELQHQDLLANERVLARDYLGKGQPTWPAFFTTYRSFLGASADDHLRQIGYIG